MAVLCRSRALLAALLLIAEVSEVLAQLATCMVRELTMTGNARFMLAILIVWSRQLRFVATVRDPLAGAQV
jgi:hypothetical protein